MSIIGLLVFLVIAALVYWILPESPIKAIAVKVVVVVVVVWLLLWLLQVAGVLPSTHFRIT